jgi:hypothetical protein
MKLFTLLTTLVGFLSTQRAEIYHNGNNNVQSTVVFPNTIEDTVSSSERGYHFDIHQPQPEFAFSTIHTKTSVNITTDALPECDYINVYKMEKGIELNAKAYPSEFELWLDKTKVRLLRTGGFLAAVTGIGTLYGISLLLLGAKAAYNALILELIEPSVVTKFCLGLIAIDAVIYSGKALWNYAHKRKNKNETVAENVSAEVETTLPRVTPETLTHTSAPVALDPVVENVVEKVEEQRPEDLSAEQPQKVFAPAFERQLSSVATQSQPKLSVLKQAEAARKNSQEQAELRLDNTREAVESAYRAVIA